MRKSSWIIILLMLLLFGCVKEKETSFSEYEKISSIRAEDLDHDGFADLKVYLFMPLVVEDTKDITITRYVSVFPSWELDVSGMNNLTDENLTKLEELLNEFSSQKYDSETRCKANLGLTRLSALCIDEDTCMASCNTPTCANILDYAGNAGGTLLHSFVSDTEEMNNEISKAQSLLRDVDEDEKKIELLKSLNNIIIISSRINANPVIADEGFGACTAVNYDTRLIREMMDIVGNTSKTSTTYVYLVFLRMDASDVNEYLILYLTDYIPERFYVSVSNITVTEDLSLVKGDKYYVRLSEVDATKTPRYALVYSFISREEPTEDVFEYWLTPRLITRTVTLTSTTIFSSFSSFVKALYNPFSATGYFVALALVASVLYILVSTFIFILKIVYVGVNAHIKKGDVLAALKSAAGKSKPNLKNYVFLGVGLLSFGLLLSTYLSKPVVDEMLILSKIVPNMMNDFWGTLAFFFVFVGIQTIMFVFSDFLKGVIVGKQYYSEIFDLTPQANLMRLDELKKTMEELRKKIDAMGEEGFDTSSEYDVFLSVPVDRIEKLLKEDDQKLVKDLIELHEDRIKGAMRRLDEKITIGTQNIEEWKQYIASLVSGKNEIPIQTLISIPYQWRMWAVQEYIKEHLEEGLKVDGESIKREELTEEKKAAQVLKTLAAKKLITSGAIIKSGRLLAFYRKGGKERIIGILAFKLLDYLSAVATKIGNKTYKLMVIKGIGHYGLFWRKDEVNIFLFLERGEEKDVIEELRKTAGRFL